MPVAMYAQWPRPAKVLSDRSATQERMHGPRTTEKVHFSPFTFETSSSAKISSGPWASNLINPEKTTSSPSLKNQKGRSLGDCAQRGAKAHSLECGWQLSFLQPC